MVIKFIRRLKVIKSGFFSFPPNIESLNAVVDLNLDMVFVPFHEASAQNLERIRKSKSDVKINVEVPVFAGKELLEKFPNALPVEALGLKTEKEGYVGICPTHLGVRNECLRKIDNILSLNPDGIWLNFIRYPTKWDEPDPYILDTCYCDRCLKLFSEYIGEPIIGNTLEEKILLIDGSYYIEWLEFKVNQITSMVKDVREVIRKFGKFVKLGMFAVPWEDKEYGAGIKRIIAQDFNQLASVVDEFSPMLYHKMCGKSVEWIKQKVDYFWNFQKPFLPLIQTGLHIPTSLRGGVSSSSLRRTTKPDAAISLDEFKKSVELASQKPSQGACIFFLEDLIKQTEKYEAVKKLFN